MKRNERDGQHEPITSKEPLLRLLPSPEQQAAILEYHRKFVRDVGRKASIQSSARHVIELGLRVLGMVGGPGTEDKT